MTKHVHLLVTTHRPLAIAELIQSVGRQYVRYVNDRYGTLWECVSVGDGTRRRDRQEAPQEGQRIAVGIGGTGPIQRHRETRRRVRI